MIKTERDNLREILRALQSGQVERAMYDLTVLLNEDWTGRVPQKRPLVRVNTPPEVA